MPAQEQSQLNAEPETDNAFQGFSTNNGEVIEVKKPEVEPKAGKPAKEAKPAKADTASDEPKGNEEPEAQEQRHKSAQQRINRSVAAQRAAERRADRAEQQIQAMEQRFASLEARVSSGGKQHEARDPNEPRPDDFDLGEMDPKYIRAVATYSAKKELETSHTAATKRQKDEATAAQTREFEKKRDKLEAAGLDKYDDFSEVVFDDNLVVSATLVELIFDSEHGADIAYQLASDPKEAAKVSALSASRQAAWFGKKEAEWESSESSDADEEGEEDGEHAPQLRKPSKTTQAPLPLKHKTRGGGSTQPVSGATSDFAAFEQAAMKQQ